MRLLVTFLITYEQDYPLITAYLTLAIDVIIAAVLVIADKVRL